MPKDNEERLDSLKELFNELDEEVEEEAVSSMSKEDQVLADVARKILRLERDMKMPGHSGGDTSRRVERLAQFIEEEDF